jgi:hypothetical protein
MDKTYKIVLFVDGKKTYTRKATNSPTRGRYTWVVVNGCNPTKILNASAKGEFAASITTSRPGYYPVLLPVTYVEDGVGHVLFDSHLDGYDYEGCRTFRTSRTEDGGMKFTPVAPTA